MSLNATSHLFPTLFFSPHPLFHHIFLLTTSFSSLHPPFHHTLFLTTSFSSLHPPYYHTLFLTTSFSSAHLLLYHIHLFTPPPLSTSPGLTADTRHSVSIQPRISPECPGSTKICTTFKTLPSGFHSFFQLITQSFN